MAKYRSKEVFEAFQFDGDLKNSKGEWYVPDWAVQAFKVGVLFYGKDDPWELYLKTLYGDNRVGVGDYVTKNKYGILRVLKKANFESLYEKVESDTE